MKQELDARQALSGTATSEISFQQIVHFANDVIIVTDAALASPGPRFRSSATCYSRLAPGRTDSRRAFGAPDRPDPAHRCLRSWRSISPPLRTCREGQPSISPTRDKRPYRA